jgi:hypothetical protein
VFRGLTRARCQLMFHLCHHGGAQSFLPNVLFTDPSRPAAARNPCRVFQTNHPQGPTMSTLTSVVLACDSGPITLLNPQPISKWTMLGKADMRRIQPLTPVSVRKPGELVFVQSVSIASSS